MYRPVQLKKSSHQIPFIFLSGPKAKRVWWLFSSFFLDFAQIHCEKRATVFGCFDLTSKMGPFPLSKFRIFLTDLTLIGSPKIKREISLDLATGPTSIVSVVAMEFDAFLLVWQKFPKGWPAHPLLSSSIKRIDWLHIEDIHYSMEIDYRLIFRLFHDSDKFSSIRGTYHS